MSMDTAIELPELVKRDRYGRPMIKPVGGGKPTPYTRVTTLAGALEDTYNLGRWQCRMLAIGLVERPDLLLAASAHRDDKTELNRIVEDAQEAAKSKAAATAGTALHRLTERIDAGEATGPVPGESQRDLDAYVSATKGLTVVASETFVVQDEIKVAGTPDRIVEFEGERFCADLKTGNVDYGSGKIAMQIAAYSRSQFYDPASGERTPLPGVNGQRGIVIHLPAGTGTCRLVWIDIAAGWEAVQLAVQVRAWRARRDLMDEFERAEAALFEAGLITDPLTAQIEAAPTEAALVALWSEHKPDWTAGHSAAAATRKKEIAR